MFTFLIAATLGAYASQRISVSRDTGIVTGAIDYQAVTADIAVLFAFLSAVCAWFIQGGQSARTYFDLAIVPWLDRHGISVKLPSIDLPVMPQSCRERA